MNTRRLSPQRAAWAALLCLVCATASPRLTAAYGVPVREDPDFEAYRSLDRSILEGPDSNRIEPSRAATNRGVETSKPGAPKPGGPEAFDLPDISAQTGPAETQSAPGLPPRTAPSAESAGTREAVVSASPTPVATPRVVRRVEQIPACAVIDLESETLSPGEAAALTQVVWNEVQRSGRTRLTELSATRHILATRDLAPSDPYRLPPSPRRLAAALRVDFMVMGNVNRFGKTYAVEILLYSASSDSVIRSRAGQSEAGFDGLLKEIPAMASETMKAVPLRVLVPAPFIAAEAKPSAAGRVAPGEPGALAGAPGRSAQWQSMQAEVEQLRTENDRQHGEIEELRAVLKRSGIVLPETPAETVAQPIPSARHGNKSAKPMKTYRRPTVALGPKRETEPAEPPKPTVEPVREPTSEAPPVISASESLAPASAPESDIVAPMPPEPTAEPVKELTPEAGPTDEPLSTPAPRSEPVVEPEASPTPIEPSAAERPAPSGPDPVEAERFYKESEKYPDSAKEGVAPIEQAVRLDPDNPRYQIELVMRLYHTRQYPQCVERGEAFLTRPGADPNLSHFVAAAHYELGNYREALKTIEGILARNPRDKDALYNRALNLGKLGDVAAVEAYRRYLEVARAENDPRHAEHIQAAEEALQALESQDENRQ